MKPFRLPHQNLRRAVVAAVALGQGAIGSVFAQTTQTAPKPAEQPAAPASWSPGLKVAIDPITKQIVPLSPEDMSAQFDRRARTVRRVEEAPKVTLYRYGMKSALLPESYMESAIATRGPDGQISFRCVHGEEGLLEASKATVLNPRPASAATAAARPPAAPGADRASVQASRPQPVNSAVRLEEK